MTHMKHVNDMSAISQEKIEKLTKKVAKSLMLDEEIAASLIYNEWETVERLFEKYKKPKAVHRYLLQEIDGVYRGAICKE